MRISEIFYSIQGEGIHTGLPTTFIRFQGCNLISRCSFCDTIYAQNGNGGQEMKIEEVMAEMSRLLPYFGSWTLITGGEPLWQPDSLEELVRWLRKDGYKIEIETNGSLPIPRWWTLVDSWNADIKCPSSGVCGVSKEVWFNTRPQDQVKFVVGTKEDLEFARRLINKYKAKNPVVLVSPVIEVERGNVNWKNEWLLEVAEFCKQERVRFSLQWHKVVYGNQRGV